VFGFPNTFRGLFGQLRQRVGDFGVTPGGYRLGRGAHELKGVPGEWHLFAVASA
jgi:hypothetical protein